MNDNESPPERPASDHPCEIICLTKTTFAEINVNPEPSFLLFNELPVEIQRHIFEIAYRLSWQHQHRSDWAYVCQKVREWIDPLIYEYMSFPGGDQALVWRRLQLYERTFRSKPKEFYSAYVRRIYTNHGLKHDSHDFEIELLSVCDNLTYFECWSDYPEALRVVLWTKSWSCLQALCINIDLFPKDENIFHLPIFQHVTQLNLTSEQPHLPSWKSLQSMENLTHMCVNMLSGVVDSKDAVDHACATAVEARKYFPPRLKYFLIIVPGEFFYSIPHTGVMTEEDKQRWGRVEDLRLGIFDERIVIGDDRRDYDPNPDYDGALNARKQLAIVRSRYPNGAGDGVSVVDRSSWEELTWTVRRRKKMKARARDV